MDVFLDKKFYEIYPMPKKVVENIQVESLPYLPVLSAQKNSRTITKHFVNTVLYLPTNLTSLLTWLIYQSNVDNSFKYEEQLVVRYGAAIKEANKLYNGKGNNKLRTDTKGIRASFTTLIKRGYILPTNERSVFIVNPLLSYKEKYMTRRAYKLFCKFYNSVQEISSGAGYLNGSHWTTGIIGFVIDYRRIINSKITKK